MPLYMYQAAYTAESLAAQLKKPENRVEAVGRAACEAVGGKLVGGWYCFGDYDLAIVADVPNNESMAAIALAIAAGGAVKSAKTTVLMTGGAAPTMPADFSPSAPSVRAGKCSAPAVTVAVATLDENGRAVGSADYRMRR